MVVPFTNADASFLTQLYGVIAIAGFGFITSYGAVYLINIVMQLELRTRSNQLDWISQK